MHVKARTVIDICNTTEETVNVNENNPVLVEETEPAENTEFNRISWAEEADEATKLEYSAYDIKKCTVEKVAVVAKGEAAKDFEIDTNTEVKKYLRFEKCGKYLPLIPALLNQFAGTTRAQEGADEEGEEICSQRIYWMLKILRNQWVQSELLSFFFISTLSEEADEATKLPKIANNTTNLKMCKCDWCK